MITQEQEEQIEVCRKIILQIGRIQESIFDGLLKSFPELDKLGQEFLFDYVYNSGTDLKFEEYLLGMLKNRDLSKPNPV